MSDKESVYLRKNPPVYAIQYTGNNLDAISEFTKGVSRLDSDIYHSSRTGALLIPIFGMNGHSYIVDKGDFIIRKLEGKFKVLKPDIFAETYEPAFEL